MRGYWDGALGITGQLERGCVSCQVRPRWSRSPVDDKTLEESIGQFTFDLGIEKN